MYNMNQQNQQNQRINQFQNSLVPNDNLPCIPLAAPFPGTPVGFRNPNPSFQYANFSNSAGPNQIPPYKYACPSFNRPPVQTTNSYNMNQQNFQYRPQPHSGAAAIRGRGSGATNNNWGGPSSGFMGPDTPQMLGGFGHGFGGSGQTGGFTPMLQDFSNNSKINAVQPRHGPSSSSGSVSNFVIQGNKGQVSKIQPTATTSSAGELKRNSNPNEKIRILTGTVEKVIHWRRIYRDFLCYYEVIASIISIQEGTVRLQKIFLLRNNKGPIMQVHHYLKDHIKIENFFVGQMLRCVGRMIAPNVMHGLSIREASPDEIATLERMCFISDHAITKAISKS